MPDTPYPYERHGEESWTEAWSLLAYIGRVGVETSDGRTLRDYSFPRPIPLLDVPGPGGPSQQLGRIDHVATVGDWIVAAGVSATQLLGRACYLDLEPAPDVPEVRMGFRGPEKITLWGTLRAVTIAPPARSALETAPTAWPGTAVVKSERIR